MTFSIEDLDLIIEGLCCMKAEGDEEHADLVIKKIQAKKKKIIMREKAAEAYFANKK